jgi:hypothetical protein
MNGKKLRFVARPSYPVHDFMFMEDVRIDRYSSLEESKAMIHLPDLAKIKARAGGIKGRPSMLNGRPAAYGLRFFRNQRPTIHV